MAKQTAYTLQTQYAKLAISVAAPHTTLWFLQYVAAKPITTPVLSFTRKYMAVDYTTRH